MIEDGDYSAASPATKKSHYTASPAKQPSMQTSRLSVFLQQSRDPAPSHASFTKPAGYSFSTVYSHDSPAVRRTRNDDEFYGSGHQQRSSSSRRSGRGQSSHTHLFYLFLPQRGLETQIYPYDKIEPNIYCILFHNICRPSTWLPGGHTHQHPAQQGAQRGGRQRRRHGLAHALPPHAEQPQPGRGRGASPHPGRGAGQGAALRHLRHGEAELHGGLQAGERGRPLPHPELHLGPAQRQPPRQQADRAVSERPPLTIRLRARAPHAAHGPKPAPVFQPP